MNLAVLISAFFLFISFQKIECVQYKVKRDRSRTKLSKIRQKIYSNIIHIRNTAAARYDNEKAFVYVKQEFNIFDNIETVVDLIFAPLQLQILAVINVVIFLAWQAFSEVDMIKYATCNWKNFENERWWTLITCAFSHKDINHILGNLVGLSIFGPSTLKYLGPIRLYVLVLTSAMFSSILQLYHMQYTDLMFSKKHLSRKMLKRKHCLGFSGVNAALFYMFTVANPNETLKMGGMSEVYRAKELMQIVFIIDVIGAIITLFTSSPIAHVAHIGGFVSGYCMLWLFKFLISFKNNFKKYSMARILKHIFQIKTPIIVPIIGIMVFLIANDDTMKNLRRNFRQIKRSLRNLLK